MIWLVLALFIFIFEAFTILVIEHKQPAKTVAWLLILFIFPIVGFIVYYFVAQQYKKKRKIRKRKIKMKLPHPGNAQTMKLEEIATAGSILNIHSRLRGLLEHLPLTPPTGRNQMTIFTTASKLYEAMECSMLGARHHIHVQFYIFRDDAVGRRFADLLMTKAREGVEVRLILDGIGCMKLRGSFVRELQHAGVKVRIFLPPFIAFFDKRINYRNHRKVVVCDGKTGFFGGMNIGTEYLGNDPEIGYWRDTHMEVTGDAVYDLQYSFLSDWRLISHEDLIHIAAYYPEHLCPANHVMQIVRSGPDQDTATLLDIFYGFLSTASERIYLTTPYFIPDESIEMALKTAALSGVDVRLIIPGDAYDSRIAKWAALSYLDDLLSAGVRVFQYEKGFVHAKSVVVDSWTAIVGTANMDRRSLFDNFELSAIIYDEKLVAELEADFFRDLAGSKEIDQVRFDKRSRWMKLKEIGARMLSPLF